MSCCSFCYEKNHTFSVCEKAKYKGGILHQELVNCIIRKYPYYYMRDFVENYLKRLNILQLDCIVSFHTKEVLQEYASRYQHNLNTRLSVITILYFYYYENIFEIGQFISTEPKRNYYKIKTKILKSKSQDKNFDCPICYRELKDNFRIITNCNHTICNDCFSMLEQHDSRQNPLCFYCRTNLKYVTFCNVEQRDRYISKDRIITDNS